jgi:type IV pilus assembly protein PilV
MKRRERGYTAVELMLALGLFAVGVSGIIAMQKLTVVSNQHAKNLAIATHVAQAWLDQLAADSTLWTASDGIDATLWVVNASDSTDGVWQLPAWDDDRKFGPGFDALGAPLEQANDARFCTHLRLTTLFDESGGLVGGRPMLAGNGLARAEVRVFWLRDGGTPIADACSDPDTIDAVHAATDSYHRVFKVSAVRQHGSAK